MTVLLQSGTVIAKCEVYYKMSRYKLEMLFIDLLKKFLLNMNIAERLWKSTLKKSCLDFYSLKRLKRFRKTECHVCGGLYVERDNSVRDDNHITGKYRGSSHNGCNLKLKLSKKIPVIFHNLKGYGSHLIMLEIINRNLSQEFVPRI